MVEVSVILPNYNHGKYLDERIGSIINQTFQDFELIILDDHSTDDSISIIEKYRSHPKVSHIEYNAVNSGSPFRQWNKGIDVSRGSLIWIAESDDFCKLNFLEETVAKMNTFPSLGLVYTQSLELDEISGTQYISFQDSPRFKGSFDKSYLASGRTEVSQKLAHENTIPNASGVLFRKSVFKEVGGADESMSLCGDWFLWVKILLSSDVYFIAEPLNVFRLTNISVRARYSKVQTFNERMKILEWMRDHGIKKIPAKELVLIRNLFNGFKLNDLKRPFQMVRSHYRSGKRSLLMIPAFALSMVDRISSKISRTTTKMNSR